MELQNSNHPQEEALEQPMLYQMLIELEREVVELSCVNADFTKTIHRISDTNVPKDPTKQQLENTAYDFISKFNLLLNDLRNTRYQLSEQSEKLKTII